MFIVILKNTIVNVYVDYITKPFTEVFIKKMSIVNKNSKSYQLEQVENAFKNPSSIAQHITFSNLYKALDKSSHFAIKDFMSKVLKVTNVRMTKGFKVDFVNIANKYKTNLLQNKKVIPVQNSTEYNVDVKPSTSIHDHYSAEKGKKIFELL